MRPLTGVDSGDQDLSERHFLDNRREGRRLFAESWGTFLLVLVAIGADVAFGVAGAAVITPVP